MIKFWTQAARWLMHHQWLPTNEEVSWQFKDQKTHICLQREFNRNMQLFEEKLEEAISSGMRSFHISKTKMPWRFRHGSLLRFHLPSGLTEIRDPQHNFQHLLFFVCLNVPPLKRKAITLVFLTEGVHRFVSCLPSNLAFKWNVNVQRMVIMKSYSPLDWELSNCSYLYFWLCGAAGFLRVCILMSSRIIPKRFKRFPWWENKHNTEMCLQSQLCTLSWKSIWLYQHVVRS